MGNTDLRSPGIESPTKTHVRAVKMLAVDGCQMKPTSAELLGRCPLVPSPSSLAARKALLGHRNFALTLRYAHLAPDHLRAEMLKTEGAGHSPRSAQSRFGGPWSA